MNASPSSEPLAPAIALVELASIAQGVKTGDAMVKRAPVEVIHAGTVHPGKYLLLVGGDVASVEEALTAARACTPTRLDELFLPHVHEDVVAALRGRRNTDGDGEAIALFETMTVCATIAGADRGCKNAQVTLREIHPADELGGKAYCVFQGPLAEVEAAIEAAENALSDPQLLVGSVVIPQLSDEMRANLDRAWRFRTLWQGVA